MSDTQFPNNGGWRYYQPQTAWTNPSAMIGKSASVESIRKHRLANPAITAKHQLSTDPAVIERELIQFQQLRGALPPEQQPAGFSVPHNSLPKRVSDVVGHIKRAAQGTAVVLDWLTSGGAPVAQELANKRAAICVGCPKNVEGSWFLKTAAEVIKSTLEARKDLTLATPSDAALKSCDACKCLLKLKVFVDSKYILGHTKPDVFNALDPRCWILSERKAA